MKYERLKQRVREFDGHPTWVDDPSLELERHATRQVREVAHTQVVAGDRGRAPPGSASG